MLSFRYAGLHHARLRPKSYQPERSLRQRDTMAMTTLLLRLQRLIGRRSHALKTLVIGVAILTMSMLTGCGPGGELEDGPIIPDSSSSQGGGANGSQTGSSGGSSLPTAGGASASLSWSPVGDPSVLGYIVYYGRSSSGSFGSCSYERSTFSSSPAATVTDLAPNTTYFFAVSAFNGLESACSAEVATVTSAI